MQSKPSFNCALITGATSGLGKALAKFLAEKKIELIQTGRNTNTLSVDLADPSQRAVLLQIISAKTPDLIINNAGFGIYGPCINLSTEEQLKMIEVNVAALVEISIHSAKELIQAGKKGTILNISSAAAFFAYPTFNVYAASKSFVTQFSLALDAELRDQGVRVLCACPGPIATPFRERASKGISQEFDGMAMSIDSAVHYLWKQIQSQKRLSIFDTKTKALVLASKILPARLLEYILKNSLKNRWQQ